MSDAETVKRTLIYVHGRDFKPAEDVHKEISLGALRAGIVRDCPEQVHHLDAADKRVVYYGDLTAEVLEARGKRYDETLDVGDRRTALMALHAIKRRKKFGIQQYDRLPGKSALPEAIADIFAPLFGSLGLCMLLIRMAAKDFASYFDARNNYAGQVRERLRTQLCEALDAGENVMLLTHGTGSVIAYDVLWQLSHDERFAEQYKDQKIDTWVTLGSPLGDSNIRKRLLGAKQKSHEKYPTNVISWHNVAAEDDYTCHDNTIADDFKSMLKLRLISTIKDHHMFNLAVRYGRSNPHSSVGYLIHPRIAKIVMKWLQPSS